MAVTFWEMQGSPTEGRDRGRFWAQRKLIVPWLDRGELAELLIGFPRQIYPYATATFARVDRVTGAPLDAKLEVATGIPDHTGGTTVAYQYAVLTVDYGTPRIGEGQPHPNPAHANDPQQEISETLEPYNETVGLDYTRFVWSDGSALKPEEAPVTTFRRSKYVLTRKNQLTVPAAALTLPGKINAVAVTPLLMGSLVFPAQTLLMESPMLSISSQLDGDLGFDIVWRMLYREEGWRFHWRPEEDATLPGGEGGSFQEIWFKQIPGFSPDQRYLMPETADFTVILPEA